jgi:predicted regulator of Ras-like GTPase activity (Roadblock/LC7/MglB family)
MHAPPAHAPANVSQVVPLNTVSVAPKHDTNYFAKVNGDQHEEAAPPIKRGASPGTAFLARYATPNDIVSKASTLQGVEGALIALPDGLLVSSSIPANMNGDTIAGFLSQIFNRVTQCTKELRMGELNNLNFTVGNVPWKVFKVGAIYFAAFGRPGQPLPTAQLAEIAAELDRKAK